MPITRTLRMQKVFKFIIVFILFIVTLSIGFIFGVIYFDKEVKISAINAEVAQYNSITGKFEWKENRCKNTK